MRTKPLGMDSSRKEGVPSSLKQTRIQLVAEDRTRQGSPEQARRDSSRRQSRSRVHCHELHQTINTANPSLLVTSQRAVVDFESANLNDGYVLPATAKRISEQMCP